MQAYNSLHDRHLVRFFSTQRMRKHLLACGLINEDCEVLPESEYRQLLNRKQHTQATLDLIAQTIVERSLQLERIRQERIRRSLEQLNKCDRVQRMREERRNRIENHAIWAGLAASRPRGNFDHQQQLDSNDGPRSNATISENALTRLLSSQLVDSDETILPPAPAASPVTNTVKKTARCGSKKPGRVTDSHGDHHRSRRPASNIRHIKSANKKKKRALSVRQQSSSSNVELSSIPYSSSAYRRSSPDNDYGDQFTTEVSGGDDETSDETRCIITLTYLGDHDDERSRHSRRRTVSCQPVTSSWSTKKTSGRVSVESGKVRIHTRPPSLSASSGGHCDRDPMITVLQRPNSTDRQVAVFKGRVKPGESLQFNSLREPGKALNLTMLIDGTTECSVDLCCERLGQLQATLTANSTRFKLMAVTNYTGDCVECGSAKSKTLSDRSGSRQSDGHFIDGDLPFIDDVGIRINQLHELTSSPGSYRSIRSNRIPNAPPNSIGRPSPRLARPASAIPITFIQPTPSPSDSTYCSSSSIPSPSSSERRRNRCCRSCPRPFSSCNPLC